MNDHNKLLPCPFCGSEDKEIVRPGTRRQSCIIACCECGCRLESSEIGSGFAWNCRSRNRLEKDIPDSEINIATDIESKTNRMRELAVLVLTDLTDHGIKPKWVLYLRMQELEKLIREMI